MKFYVKRDHIRIEPENDKDEAYLEDTLGLTEDGEGVQLQRKSRKNGMGFEEGETDFWIETETN